MKNNSNRQKKDSDNSQKKTRVGSKAETELKQKSMKKVNDASQEKMGNKPTSYTNTKNNREIPANILKPVLKIQSKNVKIPHYMKKKDETMKECKWGFLPGSYLLTICSYACQNIFQVYQLSRVCSFWRKLLCSDLGSYFWNTFKQGENVTNFQELKLRLQQYIIQQQEQMSFQFQKYFIKLFNYGSTKQNIPNKLINKLNLELQINLNKKKFIQTFKLRTFNFSSYLCTKIEQIKQFQYDFYSPHNVLKDKINLSLTFRSNKYRVSHSIQKTYIPEQIADGSIKQKAFNYFLDKNFVFTYFQGDKQFLYIFFEISLLQLVTIFRSIIKNRHQDSLSKKTKKLPLYKQLCQTQFQNFQQYVKFQADFQIHFSYHNSLKQIFTHCDTKVYPIQYTKNYAHFQVKIQDSFQKIATYKLDNKMGMSQSIQDLYLLDFVLKDRDKFLITFSGFIYARQATQQERESLSNYFQLAENQIKVLESKLPSYEIAFIIVEQTKKNLLKNVKFTLFA